MRKLHDTRPLFLCVFALLGALGICDSASAQIQQMPITRNPLDSSYAGEPSTNAGYNLQVGSGVSYDSNIFNDNANRKGDAVFREEALFNLWEQKPRWDFGFQYNPTFLFYSTTSGFNAFNQDLAANGTFRLTRRFSFAWSEGFYDMTGLFQAASNQFVLVPVGVPPNLNSTPLTPLTRSLSNEVDAHIQYQASRRGMFDLMGAYALQNFQGAGSVSAVGLFNTKNASGGARYEYRLEQHFSLGARYLFEAFSYGVGTPQNVHSVFATGDWQLNRRATLSLYGGPQYVESGGPFPIFGPLASPWRPAGGGTLTVRTDQTVLELTGQYLVGNGGGLLTTVTNSYEGVNFRRRLNLDWDLMLIGMNARSAALQGVPGKGIVNTETAGAAVEHPIFENLHMHLEYDFLRQRINRFVPRSANGDTSEVTFGVFYRFGDHSL